jgi:hypothetical protein
MNLLLDCRWNAPCLPRSEKAVASGGGRHLIDARHRRTRRAAFSAPWLMRNKGRCKLYQYRVAASNVAALPASWQPATSQLTSTV